MFGYVIPNKEDLTEEQLKRYKGCYCGLCKALKQRHGSISRMSLTYDMTFLVLVLTSLYEPAEHSGSERCIAHPKKLHAYWQNELTEYAADMNLALAYHNCMDDWRDEHKVLRLGYAKSIKFRYEEVRQRYPRQCTAMEVCLHDLSELEKAGCSNPDMVANCFAALMRELFIYREDNWTETLGQMGAALGKFIHIMDARIDMEADRKHGRYNPLIAFQMENETVEDYTDILIMLIGDCTLAFEKLPLILDVDIMRNILYSGVWQKYQSPQQKKIDKDKQ